MFKFIRKFIPALKHIDALEKHIKEISDPGFDMASFVHNKIVGTEGTIQAKSWAIKLLTMSFADTVGDAPNFLTFEMGTPELGFYVATIQRKFGKSPAQIIGELEDKIKELEKDVEETQGLLDRIDIQVSDTLKKEDLFPKKPAGFPDRIDAICKGIAMWSKLIDEIAEENDARKDYLAESDRIICCLVAIIKANPRSEMNDSQRRLLNLAKTVIQDAKQDRKEARFEKAMIAAGINKPKTKQGTKPS